MKPKVSIIVPIYNAESFLPQTIDSVLAQSFRDFELILINDGSTDRSGDICASYSDNRILYSNISNNGVSNARNVGFEKSKGEYLAFLDADDIWLPDRLQKTVKYLDQKSENGLVHTHVQVIDGESELQEKIFQGKEGDILDDLLSWQECCIPAPSSILVRREVMDSVGLFDLKLSTAADHDLFFRIARHYKIGMISEVLGLYRIHGSNMHMNIKRMEIEHVYTYRKADRNGFFKNKSFRRQCFGNMYKIISGSYWVNDRDLINALRCAAISLYHNPSPLRFLDTST